MTGKRSKPVGPGKAPTQRQRLPRPKLLEDEFRDGPPTRFVSEAGTRHRLDNRIKRYIFWAATEDMPRAVIAESVGVGRGAVYKALQELYVDTGNLRRIDAYVPVFAAATSTRASWWMCRICGGTFQDQSDCGLHTWAHAFEVPSYMAQPD